MNRVKLRHKFYKSDLFKRNATALDAWENVDVLKELLDANPEMGKLIPGGEGLRKVRIGLPGRGKRGGARVIYYLIIREKMFLIGLYAKNEQANLSSDELNLCIQLKNEMLWQFEEKSR